MTTSFDRSIFQSPCQVEKINWLIVFVKNQCRAHQPWHKATPEQTNANMAGYATKMSLMVKFKKTHFHITIPMMGCSSFPYCKHGNMKVNLKKLYISSLICVIALMIAQTSVFSSGTAVSNRSGNLLETAVPDEKNL